jgi:hypothetical protein
MIDPSNILVIIVGIGVYEDAEYPQLKSAINNANDLRTYFTKIANLDPERILHKLNLNNEQLLPTVSAWLKERKNKNFDADAIFFYYSGHAPFVAAQNGIFNFYITASDSQANDRDTLIKCNELFDRLRPDKYNNAKLIAIFDCCFSRGINAALPPNQAYKCYIISSTGGFEYAKYPEDKKHSSFTEALLEILNNGAQDIEDEQLSMTDVFNYIDNRLIEQRPSFFGDNIGKEKFLRNLSFSSPEVVNTSDEINEINWAIIYAKKNIEYGVFSSPPAASSSSNNDELILPKFPAAISTMLKIFFADDTINNAGNKSKEIYRKIYLRILKFLCYVAIKDITDNPGSTKLDPQIKNAINKIWERKDKDWLFEVLTRILYRNQKENNELIIREFLPESAFFRTILEIELKEYGTDLQVFFKDEYLTDSLVQLITDQKQNDFNFRKAILSLFKDLAFLINYNFIAIRLISVSSGYLMPLTFKHEVYDLFGNGKYDKKSIVTKNRCYPNSTILIFPKSDNLQAVLDSGRYINLWPLVIDKFSYSKKDEDPVIYIFERAELKNNLKFYYSITSEEKKIDDETPYYSIVDVNENDVDEERSKYFEKFQEKIIGL